MKISTLILILIALVLGFFSSIPEATAKFIKPIKTTPYCQNQMELIDRASANPLATAVDRIVVSKARRKLYLLANGAIARSYNVAFGFNFNSGPKYAMGDGRTPEGLYEIELKNPKSKYHLGLRVSYPNKADRAFAKGLNVQPGGDIMIHGFPVDLIDGLVPEVVKAQHPSADWTQGCVAVTDSEIEEIFEFVKVKTPIEICGLD